MESVWKESSRTLQPFAVTSVKGGGTEDAQVSRINSQVATSRGSVQSSLVLDSVIIPEDENRIVKKGTYNSIWNKYVYLYGVLNNDPDKAVNMYLVPSDTFAEHISTVKDSNSNLNFSIFSCFIYINMDHLNTTFF